MQQAASSRGIVQSLSLEVAGELKDLVGPTSAQVQCSRFKEAAIRPSAKSDSEIIYETLASGEMEDKKASHLICQMNSLVGQIVLSSDGFEHVNPHLR